MSGKRRSPRPERLQLLEADPDLASGLRDHEASSATGHSTVTAFSLARGPWRPDEDREDLWFLILAGIATRRVVLRDSASSELLGPGDLLRPSLVQDEQTLGATTAWRILAPMHLAVIDRDLLTRMAPWPVVTSNLIERALLRSRALGIRLAITQLRSLRGRLTLLLWHLADRYGRVEPGGTRLALPLTHDLLAELVSAQRPSVTKALRELDEEAVISRRRDRSLFLHGEPPASIARAAQ